MTSLAPTFTPEHSQRAAAAERLAALLRDGALQPTTRPRVALKDGGAAGHRLLVDWADGHSPLFSGLGMRKLFRWAGLDHALLPYLLDRLPPADGTGPLVIEVDARALLHDNVIARAAAARVPLQLEVAATDLAPVLKDVRPVLHDLADAGIQLALTDFPCAPATARLLRAVPFWEIRADGVHSPPSEGRRERRLEDAPRVVAMARAAGCSTAVGALYRDVDAARLRTVGVDVAEGPAAAALSTRATDTSSSL